MTWRRKRLALIRTSIKAADTLLTRVDQSPATLTYKGQSKLIGTSIFVAENDVSEEGLLTNQYLIKRCEALVNSCKERISRLDLKAAQYDINDLVNKLLS